MRLKNLVAMISLTATAMLTAGNASAAHVDNNTLTFEVHTGTVHSQLQFGSGDTLLLFSGASDGKFDGTYTSGGSRKTPTRLSRRHKTMCSIREAPSR
jgi:hypothetical protein